MALPALTRDCPPPPPPPKTFGGPIIWPSLSLATSVFMTGDTYGRITRGAERTMHVSSRALCCRCWPSTAYSMSVRSCISCLRSAGSTYAGFLAASRPHSAVESSRIAPSSSFSVMKSDRRSSPCARNSSKRCTGRRSARSISLRTSASWSATAATTTCSITAATAARLDERQPARSSPRPSPP